MKQGYIVSDSNNQFMFSFEELIECTDFSNKIDVYLYAFIGLSIEYIKLLKVGAEYQLKSFMYEGRLNFKFQILKIDTVSGVAYFTLKKYSNKYIFGALSVIQMYQNCHGRIWNAMQLSNKKKYISASYLMSGIRQELIKNNIVLDGRYIVDPYSFFCEIGYGFFGEYGFMGSDFDELSEILVNLNSESNPINIIWTELEQSQLMINNIQNYSYTYEFISEAKTALEDNCNLILL